MTVLGGDRPQHRDQRAADLDAAVFNARAVSERRPDLPASPAFPPDDSDSDRLLALPSGHPSGGNQGAGTVAGGTPRPVTVPTGWHPAPIALLLHRPVNSTALYFGGQLIVGTRCGRSALVGEHARNGPRTWQDWPRCPECSAAEHQRRA